MQFLYKRHKVVIFMYMGTNFVASTKSWKKKHTKKSAMWKFPHLKYLFYQDLLFQS